MRRVRAASSAAFLDGDDEEKSLDVQAKSPNPTTSGTKPSSESVSQGDRDTPSSAAARKEAGMTIDTRTPVECKQLNTCESDIPKLGLGSTNSVPILLGSQLEIQTEMDVSTSPVKDTAGEGLLPSPNQVPTQTTESTQSKISSGMVVRGDNDFDTFVPQVDSESPNMGLLGSNKQVRLDNSIPCSTGNDCDTSSSVVKKRFKRGSKKTILRNKFDQQSSTTKSVSTKIASLLTERSKSRKQKRKGGCSVTTGRKKKLPVEGENSSNKSITLPRKRQKKEETGTPAKKSEDKSSCDENKSKTRKKPRRELKSKALQLSSVESACETQSDPKESSTSSKSKSGRKSRVRKKLTPSVDKASVVAGNAVVVKRPRGRPRKTQLSVEKNSNLHCEPKLSLAIDLEQSVSEDSGYPSSTTTCNSRSPTEFVLTSPIILTNNTGFLHEESFQENLSPIINDSNLGATKPETDSVSDMTGSYLLDVPQNATEPEEFCLLHSVQPDFPMNENTGMEPVNSSTRNLFDLDVDLLLRQDINSDQLFSLDENSVAKLESSNDEVEDILRSPTVSSCLKGLQLSGALPCDQQDPSSQTVFDKTCHSSHLGMAAIDKSCPSGPSGESTVDWLGQQSQPAPILPPVPDQISLGNYKISQSCCSTSASVNDHSPPPVGPKSVRRVIVRRKYQRKGKTVDSKPAAPLKSKSGRKLKRTWKLCSSRDLETEQEMKNCTEMCHSSGSNILLPEKDFSGTKMINNTDLKLRHPSPCSAGSNTSLTTDVPQSTDMVKVSCELTAPTESESAVMNKYNEMELTGNLLSSTSLGDETGHECKDGALDDTQEKTGNVADNSLLTGNTGVIHHETDGKLVPKKATKVVSSPSKMEVTMRKFQLKLKKHSTKQSCSSDCGSDGGVAGLPCSNTPPLVNAMKEPSPAKESNSTSMLDAALKKAKTSVHLQTGDVDPCEIFMFNGFLPSADSDKRRSQFGGGNIAPATGSIFSNSQGGRVGSIFAGAVPSHSTSDSSSSSKFTTSHLADVETPASSRKPDSVYLPSSSVDITPSSNSSRKFTTSQQGRTESQASISCSKPDLVCAATASAAVTPSTGRMSKFTMSHCGSARTPASSSRPSSTGGGMSAASLAVPSVGRTYGKMKAKPPPSASLSMSLDTILKQMEEMKGGKCGDSAFKKINTMPHESCELKFSIPGTKKGSVFSFGEVQHKSPPACNTSLSSSEISHLILAPLSVGETLDEELKGESLFATTITDSDANISSAIEEPQVKEVSQSRDLAGFGEGEENSGSGHDKESKSEIFTAAATQFQSRESGQDLVSGGEINVKDEPESPPVMKKIHLSIADEEKEGDEIEDFIELFPDADDDDLLGDISEDLPAKTFSKCTKSAKKATDQLKVKRRVPESHRDFSPVPLDDGGFGSSFEKPPQRNPYKSLQVSQWVAEQQKRKKLSSQSALPPPSPAPGSGSSGSHIPVLQLRGRGGLLSHPWPPANINSGSSPVAFIATDLPPG